MGFAGYYSMCDDTPDIIINRPNLDPNQTDYFMLVSRAAFPLYISIGIITAAVPLRSIFARIVGYDQN